ncbi:TetR/AcrR family transcriptional regulator [Actinocorallia longicatena]|uniref:TetR/AcrR family transcriptional regulator n=2 Tax=Actinocorallia longicatena TaxID=111803 RepID=A0ABP6QMC1_9ACTN
MSRADRETQMLDVAEEVFAERNFAVATMDEIAERCGVSKPLLYDYFGSKEGLLTAAVNRARTELYEVTTAAMALGTEPRDILERGLVAYYTFATAHSRSFAVLIQEPMAATFDAVESVRRQQHGLIAPVIAAWAPHVEDERITAYTELIIGACERISLWAMHDGISPERAAAYTLDFCWDGLRVLVDPSP